MMSDVVAATVKNLEQRLEILEKSQNARLPSAQGRAVEPRSTPDFLQRFTGDPRHLHGPARLQAHQGHAPHVRREHQLADHPG